MPHLNDNLDSSIERILDSSGGILGFLATSNASSTIRSFFGHTNSLWNSDDDDDTFFGEYTLDLGRCSPT